MKIVVLIARLLLGIAFTFFGVNGLHPLFKSPPPPEGIAGQYIVVMNSTHYMQVVAALMVISGILFLVNRFVPLALVLLGPILVNILLFHLLISHPGFQGGIIATLLWFLVFNAHRTAFAGVFQAKA
jgi:hypothetical protein